MATYITSEGNYTRDIKPNSNIFTSTELEKLCGIGYNTYPLYSNDFLITSKQDYLETFGRNYVASVLVNRDIYGPCLIVDEEEMI